MKPTDYRYLTDNKKQINVFSVLRVCVDKKLVNYDDIGKIGYRPYRMDFYYTVKIKRNISHV